MFGSVAVYLSQECLHRHDVRLTPILVNHRACAIDGYGLALAPKSSDRLNILRRVNCTLGRIASDDEYRPDPRENVN